MESEIQVHIMYILSLSETKKENRLFTVIGYDKSQDRFYSLNVEESKIQSNRDIWDIGSVVEIEGLEERHRGHNPIYRPVGSIRPKKKLAKDELKNFLFSHRTDYGQFLRNNKIRYGIVKVYRFVDIIFSHSGEDFKVYISFETSGYKKKKLLVKDYRWVNYWNTMHERGIHEKRKMHFLNLFQKSSKEIYLILFKYYPKNRYEFVHYVSGFHWL